MIYWFSDFVTLLTVHDKLRNSNHDKRHQEMTTFAIFSIPPHGAPHTSRHAEKRAFGFLVSKIFVKSERFRCQRSFNLVALKNKAKAPMSTVEGASHSPQQSFSFFLKLLLNPRWSTIWRFPYCHPPLVYFGFSTKLWRWQFGRSPPIQPIMSCSFDSLLTWQTKLAPDKWSKDKTTENSTHLKCAFSAIIYKLKKVKKKAFVPADIIECGRKRNNVKPHV